MSKTREYFPFFLDFKIAFINLSKRDQANLIMSIMEYAESGEVPTKQSKQLEYSFEYVKNRIDKSLKKSDTASNNGKQGGRPSKPEAKDKQTGSKPEANKDKDVNKDVNVNLDVNKDKDVNNTYIPLSEGLFFILEEKLNKSLPKSKIKSWSEDIRKLIEIDLKNRNNPFDDVKSAIQSIADNYGKDYFPVIQSGQSFRDKIAKIENYSNKNKQKSNLGWLNK
jgi:hypothetical protein